MALGQWQMMVTDALDLINPEPIGQAVILIILFRYRDRKFWLEIPILCFQFEAVPFIISVNSVILLMRIMKLIWSRLPYSGRHTLSLPLHCRHRDYLSPPRCVFYEVRWRRQQQYYNIYKNILWKYYKYHGLSISSVSTCQIFNKFILAQNDNVYF